MDVKNIRNKLLLKRTEIFDRRKIIDEAWRNLNAREVEVEERAQNEKMSLGLEDLDTRSRDELNAIDEALKRLELGTYGLCESCGDQISMDRLEAIPWTVVCSRCAGGGKAHEFTNFEEEPNSGSLPDQFQGMTDDEIADAIANRLLRSGRIETEELDISFQDGTVLLEGALPSRTEHNILLNLLEDVMGLQQIEDHIQIDRQVFEGTPFPSDEADMQTDEEELLYGEGVDEESMESMKEGTTSEPPEEMIPEKETSP